MTNPIKKTACIWRRYNSPGAVKVPEIVQEQSNKQNT